MRIDPNMYDIMNGPMIRKSEGLDQGGDNLVDGDQACRPRLDVLRNINYALLWKKHLMF